MILRFRFMVSTSSFSLLIRSPEEHGSRMSQQVHLVGYWAGAYEGDDLCLPQEIVGSLPDDVRARVADYLDSGDLHESYRGYSWCRFDCGIPCEEMGSAERTDGVWAWPEGLSHYVREHGVILPDDFIAHALSSAPPLPKGYLIDVLMGHIKTKDDFLRLDENWPRYTATLDYWRQWSAAHRSSEIFENVRRVWRESATSTRHPKPTAEEIEQTVAELVARHGLGHERCLFFGCHERILSGMKLCARHTIR
jgi:hypothetical protein